MGAGLEEKDIQEIFKEAESFNWFITKRKKENERNYFKSIEDVE